MSKDDRSIVSWFAFAAAIAALVVAVVGLGRDDSSGGSAAGGGGGAPAELTVKMNDFSFSPATMTIPTAGAILHLVNEGATVHNLQIAELGIKSVDVPAGVTIDLTIAPQAVGEYKVICPQPGHEGAGMVGTLIVSESADTSTDTSGDGMNLSSAEMTNSQMDALMLKVAQQYPAATAGHGGDIMEPTMSADGYKEFIVESKVVDWEVEPGKWVQAWTYNGVVPAPEIHVSTGDKVRIILKNNLPQTTSLHFHGIQVPNIYDGVDPYTEHPTEPGKEHIYEWVAQGPAVGIYHSHHNAQEQIPDGMFGAFTIDRMPIPDKLIEKGYTKVDKRVNMVLNDAGVIGLS
ncbi:MAG: multicopper oxidase domain-containing protein, partial [Actinomycetota bacterium]|nr:multicopper oxidase domain-containing protein [Actinomycetota bacterium]